MNVFSNILRRIFKNKIQMLFILILPAVFMVPISLNMSTEHPLKVGILDKDKTVFSDMFCGSLKTKAEVVDIDSSKKLEDLLDMKVDYQIIIEKGFTKGFIKGENVQIKGYYLKNSVRSLPVQQYIKSFIDSSEAIALSSNGSEAKFYEGMNKYKNLGLKTDFSVISNIDRDRSYSALGLFLMFMIMTAVIFTTLLLKDKENKTFYRTLCAPVSLKSYMLQNILGFIIISFVQVTLVFIMLKYLIGIYMGDFIKLYLLFLVASIMCVSLGIAVSSISRNTVQAGFMGLFLALPMSFLGGCWWQNAAAPAALRDIGRFTPVYWVMEGVSKYLNDKSFFSASSELLILLAFSAIFFFFGTWKKESLKT